MKITDIEGKPVKLSVGSITAKNDNGKTVGVVRGISRWENLSPRKQSDTWSKVRTVWGRNDTFFNMDFVYYDDRELYFIYNGHHDKFCRENNHDLEGLQVRQRILDQIRNDGITVITVASC